MAENKETKKEEEEPKEAKETAPAEAVRGPDPAYEVGPTTIVLPTVTMAEVKASMEFPSSILLIGKKFSGKTNLIRTIIEKKKFNNVVIITLSGHTGNLTPLATDPDNILNVITDEFIEELLDFQQENPKCKTCIIFDDFINSERTLRDVKKIMQLATSGRNYGITMLVSSQTVAQVPTAIRKNAEYLFIGKNYMSSAETLSREYATGQVGVKELKAQIMQITDHSWLFFDERKTLWSTLPETEIKVVVFARGTKAVGSATKAVKKLQ